MNSFSKELMSCVLYRESYVILYKFDYRCPVKRGFDFIKVQREFGFSRASAGNLVESSRVRMRTWKTSPSQGKVTSNFGSTSVHKFEFCTN